MWGPPPLPPSSCPPLPGHGPPPGLLLGQAGGGGSAAGKAGGQAGCLLSRPLLPSLPGSAWARRISGRRLPSTLPALMAGTRCLCLGLVSLAACVQELVLYLLGQGASVGVQGRDGHSPLHSAAYQVHLPAFVTTTTSRPFQNKVPIRATLLSQS